MYADGSTRDFYQIGFSASSAGISIDVTGLKDKNFLPQTYGKSVVKAKVTGYCIKFKRRQDLNLGVLTDALKRSRELTGLQVSS